MFLNNFEIDKPSFMKYSSGRYSVSMVCALVFRSRGLVSKPSQVIVGYFVL